MSIGDVPVGADGDDAVVSGDEARVVDVVRAALQLGHQLGLPSAQGRGRRGARDPSCHLARWWRNCVLGSFSWRGKTPSKGVFFSLTTVSFLRDSIDWKGWRLEEGR